MEARVKKNSQLCQVTNADVPLLRNNALQLFINSVYKIHPKVIPCDRRVSFMSYNT